MRLSYKCYGYSNCKVDIKKMYEKAFPKCERFPFWILKHCSKEDNVHLYSIQIDDTPVGMSFTVEYNDITYLMYFTITEEFRNQNYGSKAIRNMIIRNNNVMLCIEKPTENEAEAVKTRRKNFYLRNGFYETGIIIEDTGMKFEFLSSLKGYIPTIEDLKNRYTSMTSNPIIGYIIKNTFDVDNINIVV